MNAASKLATRLLALRSEIFKKIAPARTTRGLPDNAGVARFMTAARYQVPGSPKEFEKYLKDQTMSCIRQVGQSALVAIVVWNAAPHSAVSLTAASMNRDVCVAIFAICAAAHSLSQT